MEILQTFVRSNNLKTIKLSAFMAGNESAVVDDLVSKTKEDVVTDQFLKEYWIRIFQHVKKQYDPMEKQFITDKEYVNWIELSGKILEVKTKNSEERIRQLANKRRKLHYDLHLQADNEVADLLTAETPTAGDIDAFFNSGPILVYLFETTFLRTDWMLAAGARCESPKNEVREKVP
ncbi:unnamed protein product [Mucor hiemalis]